MMFHPCRIRLIDLLPPPRTVPPTSAVSRTSFLPETFIVVRGCTAAQLAAYWDDALERSGKILEREAATRAVPH